MQTFKNKTKLSFKLLSEAISSMSLEVFKPRADDFCLGYWNKIGWKIRARRPLSSLLYRRVTLRIPFYP